MKKVLFLFAVLFLGHSCQKTEFQQTPVVDQLPTSNRSVVTSIHENALITDKYDVMGRLWYHHKRTNAGGDPALYLPAEYRSGLVSATNAIYQANKDKSLSEQTQSLLAQEVLTPQAVAYIEQFSAVIEGMADNISPESAWTQIRQFENTLMNNISALEGDITPALYISSILRNQLTYVNETGGLIEDREEDCFLGRKLKCWKNAITESAFAALEAALAVIAPTILPGGGSIDWKKAKQAAFSTGGIGLVIQIIKIFTDSDCKCGQTEPTPVDPCQKPTGIGLTLGDCGNIQTALVSGFGTAATGFTWSVQGGIAVDFPGAVTGILTAVPTLRISQTNPNIPMVITCMVSYSSPCSATSTTTSTINVPVAVNSPGEVIPIGTTSISYGDPSIFRYTFGGSYKNSPNNVFVGGGCSYHGTVVGSGLTSSGTDFIDVKWTVSTNSSGWGSGGAASVSGTSKNICSNNTASGWLNPITIQ